MKLQTRLMLSLTGVTAAVLVLSLSTLRVLVRRDEEAAFDQALLRQASAAAKQVMPRGRRNPLLPEGRAEIPESLTPTARHLVLFDADGAPLAASKLFAGGAPSLAELGAADTEELPDRGIPLDLHFREESMRGVIIPLGSAGESLLFAASRSSIAEDVTFLDRALTLLFVSAMLFTALFARWLGGVLARDVGAIANVARAVTRGDMRARVGATVSSSRETRALASDLDAMIARLAELMRAQQSFVSHAAHELRSPLTSLRGELQLALRRPREAEEYRRTLEVLLDDVDGLVRLAENLLTLARLQAHDAVTVTTEQVSATDMIEDALRASRGLAEERGVSFSIAPSTALCVRGVRRELARVLRNLVDNAVLYGRPHGVVHIAARQLDGELEVAVTDEGAGVPEGDRDEIFTPFFRGAKSRSGEQQGTGLGLAIARGIARAHGGDVRLDAAHAPGARFVMRIPGAHEPARDASAQARGTA